MAAAFAGTMLLFSAHLPAQCAGGSDPDSTACTRTPDTPSVLNPSPGSMDTQESSPLSSLPADVPAESSTVEGMPDSATHTETEIEKENLPADTIRPMAPAVSPSRTRGAATNAPVTPPPPTEFQRFVFASTGKSLPIYGTGFFTDRPTKFGPLDHGPAPAEMIVGTDDELRIRLWGQVNFSANVRVSREGEIYIPKVGSVHVAGIPFSEVPAHLRAAIEHVYRNFDMSVDLGEIHTVQVYVTGFARRPGEYTVSGLSTLVDSIFESGGPDPSGSMRHVLLKRSGKVIADFDLYALLVNGDKTGDLQLQPGDVLYIPPVGPQVGLLGSVGKPAIYELRGNQSVDTLLATAGGRTAIATGARISVERIVDHEHRQAFELATDPAGLAAPLNNGDIVRVDSIVSDYRDTVTLRGAVANPGHFRWHEGMRLSELMPDRDSLLKRDYWWRRTQLGLPAPEFITLAAPTTSAAGPTSLESIAPTALAGGSKQLPVESPVGQTNWNYAVIERLDPATMTSSLIPFAPGKLVLEHDASQDHQLMPGDVVTIFSQSEIQIPIREQTKYITLEGEFVHPGVYSEVPGETLRSLVQRAGGFTPQAYLYAAVFTRRSTQAVEQQHLNEFADQLERELLHSSTVNSPPGAAVQQAQQAQQQNRELLSHIRGARASGRIVLDLHQRADGDYDLPDMQLEDGDRFIVPYTPQTVQVLGAVFNPNSFLFQSHANEQQYLHLAGGPNREADRRRIYVLRADGSVAGRLSNSTIFSQSIGNIRLHPGDSIVVPEKSLHASVFNQALGWAQTISQSSLTAMEAAAITTQ